MKKLQFIAITIFNYAFIIGMDTIAAMAYILF